MASPVDLCNMALSHLGARAQVSAIVPPDGSVEAGYCARFYPIARREAIEITSWPFAKTRTPLAEVANPSDHWHYAYALPADCIKPLRVLQLQYLSASTYWPQPDWIEPVALDTALTERSGALFDVENGVIYTNEPEAVLVYTRDVTDTSKFTPLMSSGLSMLLAGYLAGPIIKGLDGAKAGATWREQGFRLLASAAASAGNGAAESSEFIPSQLTARR
jgi:hypothetical protein